MPEPDLKSGAQLSKLAGVSPAAITKARKNERLRYYMGTSKYDINDPLNRAFLENIPTSRMVVQGNGKQTTEPDPDLSKSLTKVNLAQAKKIIEEAALKEQQRIEKELKNAVRMGELIELEAIEKAIMTWFDRWLNSNKRGFNGSFDDFLRGAFKLFENDQVKEGEKPHKITRSELKQKWINQFESWADDGKQESMKRLQEIQMEQAKR